jgi:hypothetical protein
VTRVSKKDPVGTQDGWPKTIQGQRESLMKVLERGYTKLFVAFLLWATAVVLVLI